MIDNGKGTVINIASIGAFVAVAVRLYTSAETWYCRLYETIII